jgi:Spy/CpxP family protein refolding chaperone
MVEPAPAPPPAPPRRHHPGMAALFFSSMGSVNLKPEQKTAVDAIEADLEKIGASHKDAGQKLMNDIADGAAAGKIDRKKTDADVRELTKAVQATIPAIQDAVTRLYNTLDAEQRKTLVAAIRSHADEMHEHGMMGEHEHGMMGGHEHGMTGGAQGPGMMGGQGPGAMGGQGPGTMGGQGPGMMGGKGPGGGPPAAPGTAGGAAPPGTNAPAGGMGDHHGHEGGPMMLEKLSAELALTPEQLDKLRPKLEAQMKTQEAAMKAKKATSEKHMKQIGDAFEGDKFDAKKVGVGQYAPDMAKTMATNHVTFAETILGVLTPEQKAKFATHLREHAEHE